MPFFINPSTCLIGPTFSTEMNYQVTEIEFDLDCDAADEELTPEDEKELYDEIIGSFWEAVDGDDLVEEITAATGWCIKSIDYRHILN
jgi:hypothetical protein